VKISQKVFKGYFLTHTVVCSWL